MSVCLYPASSTCACICHKNLGNMTCMICNCREHQDLTALKERVKNLEKDNASHWKHIGELLPKLERKPHKCPLCEGSGKRLIEFPNGTFISDSCRACEGKGIVWG